MIGTRIANRYEIVAELGRGGMGVVYRARDPLLNRDVAVKILPQSLLTPATEERFQREAQLVAQMDHPAIVPIYDIGQHEGSFYFLMPVVRGTNLRQYQRERARSLGEILDIVIQVADGLDYSHARGIIHRDIKPENIMVSEEEGALRARVMDFGLAKAGSENRLTKTGTLLGTVLYLSPEQVVARDIDARSDMYSLGTVLYEALAGDPPFTGETEGILYRIVHENPRSIRSLGADIPEELEDIVMKALAKEKVRRYQTGAEMSEALRRFQANLQESERNRSIVLSTVMTAQMMRPQQTRFVGREKEFGELQRRLNMAVDGECQFVVIGGEAGIGKSRLLEELENLAKARRVRVLHGRFVEQDRTFSYQGFCEVIQEYFRSRDSGSSVAEHADLSDLAADLVALFPVLSEISEIRSAASADNITVEPRKADDRMYLYELLAKTLARIGGGKPMLLIFENLHGAEMSLDALQYVVRRLGPTPTLIAGTYRQTDIDKRHPLVKMLDGFSDDPRFASILLGPFSPSEHRMFVASMVGGGELSDDLSHRLLEATEANPFFTKELVRSLLESKGISRDDGGFWSLSGQMAIASDALPATIQQAVEKRIERLPEDIRETLTVASILGKTFEFRDLELLADSKSEVDDVVERLIYEGLIEEERESRGDRLTFSSGIVRDVLYGALSRRKRKSLHRKYAEQLEKRFEGRLERIYPQLVHHFSEGDVPEKTIDYGMKAAKRSLEAFSPDQTIEVVRSVLEFLEDEEFRNPVTEGDARMLLVEAYRMSGNIDGALREAEAASRAYGRQNMSQSARALLAAAETAWEGRRVDETRRWVLDGIELARKAGENEILARFLSIGAVIANLRGEYEQAKRYLDEAEQLAGTGERATEEALPRGGRLVVALANPARASQPAETAVIEETEVISAAFEPLATSDEHGHVIPLLAEKWEVFNEGRSLIITLRPDVRFHDGSPMTAADVKASFEHSIMARPREMSAAFSVIVGARELKAGEASEVSGLIVRGDLKLEIEILEPLPIYPALLTDPATGIVKTGDDGVLLGTGPFRIVSHDPEHSVLERNEVYWRGGSAQPLDQIEFRTLASASAIAAQLRSGEIDVGRDLLLKDMEEILRDPRFRTGLVETPKKTTYFLVFNMDSSNGRSLQLRKAMSGVIRLHDLVWRTLGRIAQPATGVIPPGILGHDAGRRRTAITREQAVEMIRASGLETPIRLRAAVHPLFQDRYRALTEALFDLWGELGIEVSIETKTMEDLLSRLGNSDGLDFMMTRWNADFDDPDNFTNGLFHSGTGVFSAYFSSPETDALCEQARAESKPDTREMLYRKFEIATTAESAAIVPLFHEIDYRIAGPKVRRLQLRSTAPYVNYAEIAKSEEAPRAAPALRTGGGILHIPIAEDIGNFEPTLTMTVEKGEIISTVFDTLTRCIEGARIVPWLASEIRADDGGRRFHFRLRDDVRFHDGRRLTSRDVRYSWERFLHNPENKMAWLLRPIRGAQAIIEGKTRDLEGFHIRSSREFTVELDAPLSFFPTLLVHPAVAIVQEGTEVIDGVTREGCIGTGPFRIVDFQPGQRLEVERNPSYWREGYPKADRLIFRFAVPPEEIRDEFLAGRFSIASELFPADVEELRHQPELAAGYREVPRLSVYFAAFNIHRPPLDDPAVRRRLMRAVDVPAIVRRVLGRVAIPAHGIIPPGLVGHAPSLSTGQPPTGEMRGGKEASIQLATAIHSIYFGQYSAVSTELSKAFGQRGIRLDVVNKTLAEFLDLQARGEADLVVGRWIADYPDSDTFAFGLMHSAGGALGATCGSPELDRLIERGRTEIDPAVRHAIYREIDEMVIRDALLIPLFHEQVYRFVRPEVEGLSLSFAVPEVAYENLGMQRI
ncbi:MAG TPA: ABC transporter substrate-binding protein [Thermoanaerobaculia bacterium]|nr:ABC transporter substrate-binding protein [Thermoanaerobaculia bacterium]